MSPLIHNKPYISPMRYIRTILQKLMEVPSMHTLMSFLEELKSGLGQRFADAVNAAARTTTGPLVVTVDQVMEWVLGSSVVPPVSKGKVAATAAGGNAPKPHSPDIEEDDEPVVGKTPTGRAKKVAPPVDGAAPPALKAPAGRAKKVIAPVDGNGTPKPPTGRAKKAAPAPSGDVPTPSADAPAPTPAGRGKKAVAPKSPASGDEAVADAVETKAKFATAPLGDDSDDDMPIGIKKPNDLGHPGKAATRGPGRPSSKPQPAVADAKAAETKATEPKASAPLGAPSAGAAGSMTVPRKTNIDDDEESAEEIKAVPYSIDGSLHREVTTNAIIANFDDLSKITYIGKHVDGAAKLVELTAADLTDLVKFGKIPYKYDGRPTSKA
jgi:hypothetical protein